MLCLKDHGIFFSKFGSLVLVCKSWTYGSFIYSGMIRLFCDFGKNLKLEILNQINNENCEIKGK